MGKKKKLKRERQNQNLETAAELAAGNISGEKAESLTRYGEFVPSFFSWVTPDEQRNIAEKLANPGEEQNYKG